ncbi:serine/threonine-protein kinase RIO3 [Platysternon megacephalum]|uniref:Serine/threonine-protein kinase RIO3 n=1 Tax=Platysternon megacephalum TaxID=55544 RepID=A0A4D9EWH4_9SAUR|nr:serine/threonine-protein kinase RIO3 [Platysternon megacephalum]
MHKMVANGLKKIRKTDCSTYGKSCQETRTQNISLFTESGNHRRRKNSKYLYLSLVELFIGISEENIQQNSSGDQARRLRQMSIKCFRGEANFPQVSILGL